MPRKRKRGSRPLAIPRHPWVGTTVLSAERQLNVRCFAALAEAVKNHPDSAGTPALQVLSESASQIDARVCERAGSCPVLLVELNFNAPEFWERATVGMHLSPPPTLLTQQAASPLLHEILMQVWSLSRSLPRAASLFFGMAPQVREAIGRLTGEQIDRIAQEHALYLRPRWEDRRTFWSRLLEAATGTNDEALINVQLHCLSLLGGELVPLRRDG
jgi:hypothetical protein